MVSLRDIRILVSTNRLEQGTLAWARIEGLSDDETPFAFGSAVYPLRVAWRLNTHAVIEIVSPFGVRVYLAFFLDLHRGCSISRIPGIS